MLPGVDRKEVIAFLSYTTVTLKKENYILLPKKISQKVKVKKFKVLVKTSTWKQIGVLIVPSQYALTSTMDFTLNIWVIQITYAALSYTGSLHV